MKYSIKRFSGSSKKKKKKSERDDEKTLLAAGGAAALSVGAREPLFTVDIDRKAGKFKLNNPSKEVAKEHLDLSKKLIEKIEKQGTGFYDGAFPGASHYNLGNPGGYGDETYRRIHKSAPSKDIIMSNSKTADIVAHEYGHSQYYKGREGSIIGKAAHKLARPAQILSRDPKWKKIGLAGSALNGFDSGRRAKKAEKEGKEESLLNKSRTALLPAIINAPMITKEVMASRKGYKTLKELGASKELLKQSRGRLTRAGLTYLAPGAMQIGAGYAGRYAGKKFEDLKDSL